MSCLGLLKVGQGVAVNVLRNLNIDFETVRSEVEKLVGYGPEIQVYGDPALTGKVKKVFEYANEEAANLNHNYVGTEHLLLGLLRQTDGVAAQVLENLNVNLKEVAKKFLKNSKHLTCNFLLLVSARHSSCQLQPGSGRNSMQASFEKPCQALLRIKCLPQSLWPRSDRDVPRRKNGSGHRP